MGSEGNNLRGTSVSMVYVSYEAVLSLLDGRTLFEWRLLFL
jgi:hypothetical protein